MQAQIHADDAHIQNLHWVNAPKNNQTNKHSNNQSAAAAATQPT